MAYRLTLNATGHSLPEVVTSGNILHLASRRKGEAVVFDESGDIAFIINKSGDVLAEYEYRGYTFSQEAYLNG